MDLSLHPGQIHLQNTAIGSFTLALIAALLFSRVRKFAFGLGSGAHGRQGRREHGAAEPQLKGITPSLPSPKL